MTDWFEAGAEAWRDGQPRHGAPSEERARAEWLRGWDAAAAEDETDATIWQVAHVKLLLRDGRLHLVDGQGRLLGTQVHVAVEAAEHGHVATVVFSGVKIETD